MPGSVFIPAGVPAAAVTPHKLPTPAGLASNVPATPPPTKVRMHSASLDPAPTRLTLPSPEELGLAASAPTAARTPVALDWNLTHQRLKELGAVGFHLDHPSPGQTRVTFWLPTTEPGRTQLVEATAASESDAVNLALRQADSFRMARR